MKTSRSASVGRYALLIVLTVLFLVPFYIVIRNALSSQQTIASPVWHWLPDWSVADNLAAVLGNQNVPVLRSLINSAVVSVLQTSLTVAIAAMAGYGLARIENRFARPVLVLTLITLMVPAAVTFIPSFVMVSSLGWISSLRGLIIPVLFVPLPTFLFRQYFLGFPHELEEAAYLDGAGYWRTFVRVVVPNTRGIAAAVGVLTFISAWNAFLWPLLIGQDNEHRTVQVALSQFLTAQRIRYPELFLGSLLSIIPVLLIFLFLQRQLVQGVERSGID